MSDFDRFAAFSLIYFAAASFGEASQRLLPAPADGWAWQGFLGSTDPVIREMLDCVLAGTDSEDDIRAAIAPRNLAGLADPRRNRMVAVDLDVLIEKASLLGLTKEEIRREIPRLRGQAFPSRDRRRPAGSRKKLPRFIIRGGRQSVKN